MEYAYKIAQILSGSDELNRMDKEIRRVMKMIVPAIQYWADGMSGDFDLINNHLGVDLYIVGRKVDSLIVTHIGLMWVFRKDYRVDNFDNPISHRAVPAIYRALPILLEKVAQTVPSVREELNFLTA